MAFYIAIPELVEAITFDELVAYGIEHAAEHNCQVVNGFPWTIHYKGNIICHVHDHCYSIPTRAGCLENLTPGDLLIVTDDRYLHKSSNPDYFNSRHIDVNTKDFKEVMDVICKKANTD